MGKLTLSVLILFMIMGCSSAELVENWKNPDIVIFDADKVLVVGMTYNEEARVQYETKLRDEFEKRGVEAMRSIDLFDVEFTSSERSEQELGEVEQQLLDKDFDAILFTKVTGIESIEANRRLLNTIDRYDAGFEEDYISNQNIYFMPEDKQDFTIYHAETSLYCICPDKDRELIWRGSIDINDPVDMEKSIDDYIGLVIMAMEDQDLIFRKKSTNEVTGL
ncbi:hypothetical protein [Maribacter polysiphoniae]|uniref:Cardiolipin synthetase n=2 Tax=Maribacter polysiphoniae TaxID=429344 RepID=A0A316E4S2_9FLAO|nr:hypothetical protein [Maribacter polysiphoniae]PWK23703.1 hypothetical protein LX92_02270 [Maribacter polysiphoniae]